MGRRTFLVVHLLTLVIGAAPFTGCATMGDVVHERRTGGGTTVTYPVDVDQAFEIAQTVFHWEVGERIELHREQGYLLTSTEPGAFSWGSVMGAWIEDVGVGQSKVTVVTKRRWPLAFATTLTEGTFHRRFAQAVAIIQSGGFLPETPPRYGFSPRSE